jgi:hypothetical protein
MTDKEIAVIEAAVKAASTLEMLLKQGRISGVTTQQPLIELVNAVSSYKTKLHLTNIG